MAKTLGKDPHCPIARTLEVVGERWSFLVLREAFFGRTRFSEFRERLGISPDILAARLATMVEFGVLERHPYRESGAREREEYRLTDSGRELLPVLGALAQWSNKHRPLASGPSVEYREAGSDERLMVAFATEDGRVVDHDAVRIVPGPGAMHAAA